ncbi:hypothetical protein [Halobellus sp. H-GB7]|uniref:hypothetical protein n=1 Tax=Halobellus sp. H-GB7 TaxID=3069756 RepID=UPI0027B2731F|nr:hypothetical protein [Halobellus sp. H-GB7]MDQ2053235.1 hypothetical protein [Halobellus sp. H-GB7]
MSFPQVDWTLSQLASVADAQPDEHPLTRVDRDDAEVYETGDAVDMAAPMRTRTAQLKQANYVGATLASADRSPIGTEYDYHVDDVVRVRVEGLHHSEWGHIDPAGQDGVAFAALVDAIQDAIDSAATFPQVPGEDARYTHLLVTNDDPQSSDWADFYRYSFDIEFSGYEER